jgi:hypothetical protein
MKLAILLIISLITITLRAETPDDIYAKGKLAYDQGNFVEALEYLVQYRTMRGESLSKNPTGETALVAAIADCKDRLSKLLRESQQFKTKGVIVPP